MATSESTATNNDAQFEFEPFAYGHKEVEHASLPGGAVQRFADLVQDISMGSETILRLIEWDEMRGDDHKEEVGAPPPVLSVTSRSILMRLVAANMDVLSSEAERLREWAYKHHTPEGRAAERERMKHMARSDVH